MTCVPVPQDLALDWQPDLLTWVDLSRAVVHDDLVNRIAEITSAICVNDLVQRLALLNDD